MLTQDLLQVNIPTERHNLNITGDSRSHLDLCCRTINYAIKWNFARN